MRLCSRRRSREWAAKQLLMEAGGLSGSAPSSVLQSSCQAQALLGARGVQAPLVPLLLHWLRMASCFSLQVPAC